MTDHTRSPDRVWSPALRNPICHPAELAPVPFHKNIAAPLAGIVMRYPVGTRAGRLFPPSLVPGVSVAIPTLVPGNPHMVTGGARRPPLDDCTRWRQANHNIGSHGAEGQGACKKQSHQSLKNHTKLSFSHPRALARARAWPYANT